MISWARGRLKPRRKTILEILSSHSALTGEEISKRSLGAVPLSRVHAELANLEKDGFIGHDGSVGFKRRWEITRSGRLALADESSS